MEEYTLIRARRRTLSMKLAPDGTLVVRAPLTLPRAQIDTFVTSHGDWIANARARLEAHRLAHPEPTEAERAALIERAKQELPARVAYWSAVTGLTPTGVKITSARTRFGSCSSRGSVCFSWHLVAYPDEAIDLVVVHELCHLAQPNHSAAFYDLLARYLPDHRERAQLLRK